MEIISKISTPIKIYFLFGILLFFFTFIGIPLLSLGYADGEQRPFILLSYIVDVMIYGYFTLAILTTIIFWRWFKKQWYINVVIFCLCSYPILVLKILRSRNTAYTETLERENKGKSELTTRREYYPNTKRIRSERFYLDDNKDSIWTIYSEDGKILSREIYKNGKLLRKVISN